MPDSNDSAHTDDSLLGPTPIYEPINQTTMTDADWLNLRNRLPKAITAQEAKRIFPNLGDLRTVGGGPFDSSRGVFHAYLHITMFGYRSKIEFNFRGEAPSQSKLNSFYFQIWDIDSVTAEKLFTIIRDFYTERYGKCYEESETFEYYYQACYWKTDSVSQSLVKNVYAKDRAYVGW